LKNIPTDIRRQTVVVF